MRAFEAGFKSWGSARVRGPARLQRDCDHLLPARLAAMPLHKFPVGLWKKLRLREGIYSRLPQHYLRSLEEERTPMPVHYRPHGAKFKINPKNGQRERVEDVPIPIHYPRESQLGLWGGEGWILGHRYVNNDKVGEQGRLGGRVLLGLYCFGHRAGLRRYPESTRETDQPQHSLQSGGDSSLSSR